MKVSCLEGLLNVLANRKGMAEAMAVVGRTLIGLFRAGRRAGARICGRVCDFMSSFILSSRRLRCDFLRDLGSANGEKTWNCRSDVTTFTR